MVKIDNTTWSSESAEFSWSIIGRCKWPMIDHKWTKWTYAGDVHMLDTSPYFEYISTWYVLVYYVTLIYIIILIKNKKIVADS